MLGLPGVGPKMAHLLLQESFGKTEGISVDTHVHRIAYRIGWVENEIKNRNKTAGELEKWLPKERWEAINPLLVGFGQTICRPVGPKCDQCPL